MNEMIVKVCYKCGNEFKDKDENLLRNWCDDCAEFVKSENKKNYKTSWNQNEQYFLDKSNGMNLYDILEQIIKFGNKDFIFNLIHTKEIQDIIGSVKGMYKVGRDEVVNNAILVITEFFLDGTNDLNEILNNFKKDDFINKFKLEIKNKTKKKMRENYNINEIPLSGTNIYEGVVYTDFEKAIIDKIDLINALDKLPIRSRYILKCRFYGKMLEKEISKNNNISRNRISEIITESCYKLKKYL